MGRNGGPHVEPRLAFSIGLLGRTGTALTTKDLQRIQSMSSVRFPHQGDESKEEKQKTSTDPEDPPVAVTVKLLSQKKESIRIRLALKASRTRSIACMA